MGCVLFLLVFLLVVLLDWFCGLIGGCYWCVNLEFGVYLLCQGECLRVTLGFVM